LTENSYHLFSNTHHDLQNNIYISIYSNTLSSTPSRKLFSKPDVNLATKFQTNTRFFSCSTSLTNDQSFLVPFSLNKHSIHHLPLLSKIKKQSTKSSTTLFLLIRPSMQSTWDYSNRKLHPRRFLNHQVFNRLNFSKNFPVSLHNTPPIMNGTVNFTDCKSFVEDGLAVPANGQWSSFALQLRKVTNQFLRKHIRSGIFPFSKFGNSP
jgi:hypothetical protein